MKKVLSAAIGTVLVLLMIFIGVVASSLGKIVKTAVETAGSLMLGASVTLDQAAISPWSGRGTLNGLVIGNPDGFKSSHAASVASIEFEVKLSSLLSDMIVVERVAVRDPELIWEVGHGGSNLKKLQRNAEESSGRLGGSSAASVGSSGKKEKSLLIRDFTVTGGKVGLAATALGGQGLKAALPGVHLTNLGGEGRSPSDVASQALRAITASAQAAVSNIGGKALDRVKGGVFSRLGALFKRKGK
jgi:hypothetical protein